MDAHKNLAYSTVATAPTPAASGTSLTVTAGQGTRFPAVPFNATIWASGEIPVPTNAEIVRVTNIAGDTLTITRTQEGTSARAILVGDQIAATITAQTLTDIETAFAGTNSSVGTVAGTDLGLTVNTSGITIGYPKAITTAMQSNAVTLSNIRVSAGTTSNLLSALTFADGSGVSWGLNASTITATVKTDYLTSQSTQFLALTLGGNTAGTTTFHASNNASLFIHGGNNITVSGNGSSVTISGANVGGAQTGISGIIVSDATYTSGTVSFSNAGNITISSSVNGATQYIRLSGNSTQSVQTQMTGLTAGLSNVGNTSGDTGLVSHRLVLAGGNNITLSGSTNGNSMTITVSGANAGGAQTGISGVVVSDTTYTSGTVSFSNAGNITISSSVNGATQYIRLSGNAAQTTQSAIEGFGVSNTGQTAGNTGISTGIDWVLAGSGSITLSQSTAAGTNTIWVQHPAWLTTAMQSNAATLSNIRVSAGTTSNLLSALTFADSNGVSWGINASTITATVKTDYLTSQSTQFMALTLGGNTAGTTTFHATNNASLFWNGGNNITLSGNGSTVTISAAAQSNQQMTLYATSNTTQSSTGTTNASSMIFAGAGIASVGITNGSVVVSVPSGGGGLTNIRVSAGTTSNLLSDVTFSDSNGISFGINASTITASANTVGTATTYYPVASANSVGTVTRWAAEDHRHAGIGGAGISTDGNTAGNTGSQVGTYWFAGSNNITLSQQTSNNGSHTLYVQGDPLLSQFEPWAGFAPVTNSTLGQSTVYFTPFDVQAAISASRINFFLSLTHTYSGAPQNSTAWLALGYALYTRGTGASSERISTVTSYSLSYISASVSSSTRLSVTNYIGLSNATSHSTSQYGVNNATVSDYLGSSIAGYRVIALPLNMTLTPGRYWLAFSNQSASQGNSIVLGHSVVQVQVSNNLAYRVLGAVSAASNASVFDASNAAGTYSAQTAAFPNTIPLSNSAIRVALVGTFPFFNISGIATSSNIL